MLITAATAEPTWAPSICSTTVPVGNELPNLGAPQLLRISDEGQTWSLHTRGLTSAYDALFALDAQHVWAGDSEGALLASTTGGR